MSSRPARPTTSIAAPIGEGAGDSFLRQRGRALILAMYTALRSLKLYPAGHATVQRALDDLAGTAKEIVDSEQDLELRIAGEFIFVNGARLRLDLDNYAAFSHVMSVFRVCGIGVLHVDTNTTARDWQMFLALAQASSTLTPDDRLHDLAETMHKAGVTSIALGKSPNIKKIKRVVQGIVDQILNEETSLIGLTTIRDYDEYTFTHSVNVCIFAVALGKRLGLSKVQLYDLGMAALFHDIGKSRVPLEVLNKQGGLADDEWRMIAAHPWLGVLALFQLRGSQEYPYRSMVVAIEHHMKRDLTGYPRPIRPRQQSMFSKIVAVADGFDAATSRRAYQTVPYNPAEVLREMRDNPRRGMDPVVVKAFINLTGIYPIGTLVVLDTFELGIVHAANPIPEMLARPLVKVISDSAGNLQVPGTVVDLADRGENGEFSRTIIKTENPERYGVRVADYFV
jgi:HD-GYP domain-containing protein (c-di-GMP phosphodiesterase class II)